MDMNASMVRGLIGVGLSVNDAKLYLGLVELGEATVQQLAEYAGIKRTTTYTLLEDLKKKGFVYETKVKKQTLYIAEDPRVVIDAFRDAVNTLDKRLVTLHAFYTKKHKRPRVMFFDGAEGFRKIWQVIFRSEVKEYLIITDPEQFLGFAKKYYIRHQIIEEKLKRGIKSRHLVAGTQYAKDIISRDRQENRESRMLPHQMKPTYTKIIFGDSVALISPASENTILIIESESFAKTETALFEALWGGAMVMTEGR
ncbi:MAG: helix-turn-helix domain-containing protein [Patescibacteria group bacterium]